MFASIRKRSQLARVRKTFAGVAHIWRLRSGVLVTKRRTVVTFALAPGLRVSKVSTVTGILGLWSRNAEMLSLLDVALVSRLKSNRESWPRNEQQLSLLDVARVRASQNCQPSQGSGGSWSRNAELLNVSTVTVISGVLVAKRRVSLLLNLAVVFAS